MIVYPGLRVPGDDVGEEESSALVLFDPADELQGGLFERVERKVLFSDLALKLCLEEGDALTRCHIPLAYTEWMGSRLGESAGCPDPRISV